MAVVLALLVVGAYLLGSFPGALLVARAAGRDVLAEGSGNPGASNVLRLAGWRAGLAAFALDFLKGLVPSLVGLALAGRPGAFALGIAAVIGHVFPLTRKFRGGRGVATAGGVVAVLYPLITLGLVAVWVAVAYGLRLASLASLLVVVAFPAVVALTGYGLAEALVTAGLALLIVARHAPNLRRMLRGQEHRLGGSDGERE